MQVFSILLPLAMIFVLSGILCGACKKLHIPFVVGELLAGSLLGLVRLIPGQTIITSFTEGGLAFFAKIGVILIMFSAGLGAVNSARASSTRARFFRVFATTSFLIDGR